MHGKTINGQTYYYLREVARVDGKPKIVSQRYLGKAEDIAEAMEGASGMPARTRPLAFGDGRSATAFREQVLQRLARHGVALLMLREIPSPICNAVRLHHRPDHRHASGDQDR
ncbi:MULTISPECIES: hypothetical protein [unclassified Arthrobacter]|uniref:hypothetical protein n=1 Tax=Pseudarthrobacter sp. S6 TaxID=3418420 RepID=UPI0033989FCD